VGDQWGLEQTQGNSGNLVKVTRHDMDCEFGGVEMMGRVTIPAGVAQVLQRLEMSMKSMAMMIDIVDWWDADLTSALVVVRYALGRDPEWKRWRRRGTLRSWLRTGSSLHSLTRAAAFEVPLTRWRETGSPEWGEATAALRNVIDEEDYVVLPQTAIQR
jgi:hypothetical protein